MKVVDVMYQDHHHDGEHFIFHKRIGGNPEPENAFLAAVYMDDKQLKHILQLIDYYEEHEKNNIAMNVANYHFRESLVHLQEFLENFEFKPV